MKIPTMIRDELERTGLPWTVEDGGRHNKIRLAGRLVGICPKGKKVFHRNRAELNLVSQIRRAAQEFCP